LREVTADKVQTVVPSEVIARITAQVCLQPGLSGAYQEFLDFSGHEVYFAAEPALVGRTFGEALLAYEHAAVIGLRFSDGRVVLDPPPGTVIGDEDTVVVVGEDDHDLEVSAIGLERPPPRVELPAPGARAPKRFLLVGWSSIGRLLLAELDHHVGAGSSALVLVDRDVMGDDGGPRTDRLEAISVSVRQADTTAAASLADALADAEADHVVILCSRELTPAEADARALTTLMQLRQLLPRLPRRPSVVTELLDVRDVELAPRSGCDDFVVSEHLSSLMMVQLAENRELDAVFADLFGGHGTDLCLKPLSAYLAPDGPVAFAEVVRAARDKAEAVIGYRAGGEVVLNPPKSRPVALGDDEELVVLTPSA
jgi:hypothetical protein